VTTIFQNNKFIQIDLIFIILWNIQHKVCNRVPAILKDNIDTHDRMPTTTSATAIRNFFQKLIALLQRS
jgi:hypothetical protein